LRLCDVCWIAIRFCGIHCGTRELAGQFLADCVGAGQIGSTYMLVESLQVLVQCRMVEFQFDVARRA
jgi:hypothetical protein